MAHTAVTATKRLGRLENEARYVPNGQLTAKGDVSGSGYSIFRFWRSGYSLF